MLPANKKKIPLHAVTCMSPDNMPKEGSQWQKMAVVYDSTHMKCPKPERDRKGKAEVTQDFGRRKGDKSEGAQWTLVLFCFFPGKSHFRVQCAPSCSILFFYCHRACNRLPHSLPERLLLCQLHTKQWGKWALKAFVRRGANARKGQGALGMHLWPHPMTALTSEA